MTVDLTGKRLLLLGGAYNTKDIREYADKNGVVLIAVGNNPNHPTFQIADETYNANVTCADDLIKVIEDYHIDGVFPGGNEDIISILFDVVEKTGVHFYANREQWDITGNKRAFKTIAAEAGLPVVPEFALSAEPTREELDAIEYPVVIKPIDGMGSRGVFLCQNEQELLAAQKEAVKFSRSKTLMVEKFMSGFITVFYMTVIDGKIHIASMTDKYAKPSPDGGPIMPTIAQVYLYPSNHLQDCIDRYFPAMENLLRLLKIENGVVGIQGFCDGKDIVFTEMGYRLGGTSQQNYTKALYGNSNMFLIMNYALTGKMTDEPYSENPYFQKPCATVQLINKGGTVAKEEGVEIVKNMPEVVSFEHHHKVGSHIPVVDNVSMVHFRIFLVGEDMDHLKRTIRKIQQTIRVTDANGNSMLDDDFDIERLGKQ